MVLTDKKIFRQADSITGYAVKAGEEDSCIKMTRMTVELENRDTDVDQSVRS